MSVSLFRRWRSQRFSDLVGQESVVSTLQNVLAAGSPARAYLFCGPRGTGKTSSARIFAKALNCEEGPTTEPCDKCSQCLSIADGSNLDVLEIDAASHTQVDKIRDFIVEKVHYAPVSAKHKVYIIDEVHKLSTSSFNALLKTLEEPPPHVVFILATTHPHEMPATILSRCQRYDFRPLMASETEAHLKMIAESEKIELDEDAARQLARAADGSLRDALVLFEQATVFSDGIVTRDKVLDLLGGVGYEVMEAMFLDLQSANSSGALRRLDEWIRRGRDLKRLAESFQNHLRMLLLLKVKSEDQSIHHLSAEERQSLENIAAVLSVASITQWLKIVMEALSQIRHGRQARLEWELMLVTLAHPEVEPNFAAIQQRVERLESGSPSATANTDGAPSNATSDPQLLARLEALEKAPAKVSETPASDPKVATAITAIKAELENLRDQMAEFKSQAAPAEVTQEPLPEPVEQAKPATPAPTPTPMPVQAIAQALDESLTSDIVDEWLIMPEVMVTGPISRGGQIGLAELYQEPEPVKPPEPNTEAAEPRVQEQPPQVESPKPVVEQAAPKPEPEPEHPAPQTPAPQPPTAAVSDSPELPSKKEFFRKLMHSVKEKDIRLHAVLADAKLTQLTEVCFELSLPAGYDWHFGKVKEGKTMLENTVAELLDGRKLQMECSLGGEKASPPKESEHDDLVSRASGIFSGASIVE